MEKNKLFGTDGIRGEFQKWPLTEQLIYVLSLAVSLWLKNRLKTKKKICVLIGKDTRFSCNAIEKILAGGFTSKGITVYSAGVIPTPGLAFLANTMDVKLGIMISASHNPAQDNGIKFFKHNGFKLNEKEEHEIENIAFKLLNSKSNTNKFKKIDKKLKKIPTTAYLKHLKTTVGDLNLRKMRIVVDCACGAVSNYAGKALSDLGAKVFVFNNKPNGFNINLNCGSLHPEQVAALTLKKNADIGFSFDGDGDRVVFSDEKGKIRDGDYIMSTVAEHFLKTESLANKTVIATSMSNFGLEKFLEKIKIKLIRADVGDKYVLREIINHRANFGGEQSGHIIFFDHATTGDGILTALQLLRVLFKKGKKASQLAAGFKKYPQLIYNVPVKEKKDFKKMPMVWKKIQQAHKSLKNRGRLVVRYSGTERLARIMVEGITKKEIKDIAVNIGQEIEKEIGC